MGSRFGLFCIAITPAAVTAMPFLGSCYLGNRSARKYTGDKLLYQKESRKQVMTAIAVGALPSIYAGNRSAVLTAGIFWECACYLRLGFLFGKYGAIADEERARKKAYF